MKKRSFICLFILVLMQNEAKANCLGPVAYFASQICGEIEKSGTKSTVDTNGKLNVNVGNIVKRVIGGVSADISKRSLEESYNGVLQDQLGAELFNVRDCRKKMAEVAVPQVCKDNTQRTSPKTRTAIQTIPQKHIERRASVSGGFFINIGEWSSQAFCQNGQTINLEIDFIGYKNGSFYGFSKSLGSINDSDEVRLVRNEKASSNGFHKLYFRKKDSYIYGVYILNDSVIKGRSLGPEKCDINLRRQ